MITSTKGILSIIQRISIFGKLAHDQYQVNELNGQSNYQWGSSTEIRPFTCTYPTQKSINVLLELSQIFLHIFHTSGMCGFGRIIFMIVTLIVNEHNEE